MKKILIIVVCLIAFATSCKRECKCIVHGKDYPITLKESNRDNCYYTAQNLHILFGDAVCIWE